MIPPTTSATSGCSSLAACATAALFTGSARTVRFLPLTTSTLHSPSAVPLMVTVTSADFALRAGALAAGFGCAGGAGRFAGAGFAAPFEAAGAGFSAAGLGAGCGAAGVDAVLVGADGLVTVGDSFLVVDFWAAARSRAGLVIVTSAGEKDRTSLEPVGRICRKSPSAGSPRAMTLPERPSGIPTAAAVNHTMGGRPSAISVAICAISVSDKGCGVFLDCV